jgi:hypothetical protein
MINEITDFKFYRGRGCDVPQTNKQNKLRGLQSASELCRLSDRRLLAKFNANFCG